MSEDLPAILRLLDESTAAMAAKNSRLASAKLEALLTLSRDATSDGGVQAFLQGLTLAFSLCLVLRNPDQAERLLEELQDRLRNLASPELASDFRFVLVQAQRDIHALRRGGHGRAEAVPLFFEQFDDWLPAGQRTGKQTPQAGGHILRAVVERGDARMQPTLTLMVLQIVGAIVEDRFRSRNWGNLLAWLDEVEPYLTRCDPGQCLRLIAGWSAAYRTVALHGHAEHTVSDVLDRTESLIADTPAPTSVDAAAWQRVKDGLRQQISLQVDVDRATILGSRRDAEQAMRRFLQSEFAASLPTETRHLYEQFVSGERRATADVPVWELGYSRGQLIDVLECLRSDRWEEACDILAPLAASQPERDGDLAAGVPFLLAACIATAFPRTARSVSAEIALLKEAVRQTERQRLEASDQARGTLNIMESDILKAPYASLRELLLGEGRIGEAIRVETLLAERDHRLPVSQDQALLEQASGRLPSFPGESDFWTRAKATAGAVHPRRPGSSPAGTVKGRDWLALLLQKPPHLELGRSNRPPLLPDVTVRDGEAYVALTLSNGRLAAALRDDHGREQVTWIDVGPVDFNRAVLTLQLAIRQHSPSVAAEAEALGTMLIGPIEGFLRRAAPRRLLVEPAGAVSHVPFPALRIGGTYLAERFEIVLQDGRPEPPDAGSQSGAVVSIGAADRGSRDALRWVEKDLELVASFAAATGLHVDQFGHGTARKAPILERLAHPCRLLHLSSHFQAQLLDLAASAFVLEDGEQLTVGELSRCTLAGCDLALLLGCETAARPPAAPGSPIVGVDAALLRLGVHSVVSSQWPVDDLASHLFLKAFLQAMAMPGTAKATAVQQAQVALMTSEHLYLRHPNHWAAFTLTGRG